MKTYLLIGCIDEGIRTLMRTQALDVRDAIKKFKLYPYTYPDDWDGKATYEHAFERVCRFYNVDNDPSVDLYHEGNFVDGDSAEAYVILELGDEIHLYGAVSSYFKKVITI